MNRVSNRSRVLAAPRALARALVLGPLLVVLAGLPPVAAMPDRGRVTTPAPREALEGRPLWAATSPGEGVVRALAPAAREPSARGRWPLSPPPEVVHRFEAPAGLYAPGHRGVDLGGEVGQVVRSSLAGTVRFAGVVAGRGVVSVDHGDLRTTYEPVTATVSRGDHVDAGDPVGRLTFSGTHCLPSACLHWGLLRGQAYLDPLTLVGDDGPRPVRLLPW